MAKDKDRALNPAAAQRKADKAKALKKSKASLQTQRNERLARRNPDRLQRQIDDLKAEQAAANGQLRPRDRQTLEQLERDVAAIRKARDASGYQAPERREGRGEGAGRGGRGGAGSSLGKRRRGSEEAESSATDEDVRRIPMPEDTPPPIPRPPRRANANDTPLGDNSSLPPRPAAPAQTTYSAAPQLRDLRKEATTKFVPAAVARQIKAAKGEGPAGRLLEPEEADRLEQAGYYDAKRAAEAAGEEARFEVIGEEPGGEALEEEEARFAKEMEGLGDGEAVGEELKASAKEDAEKAAQAAVEEAEHMMMEEEASGTAGNASVQAEQAERKLRHVEIEEVEDEDL